MHKQTLTLFWGNHQVATCTDISLEMNRERGVDFIGGGYIPGLSTWLIRAENIVWIGGRDLNEYVNSNIALYAKIEMDGVVMLEGEVTVERMDSSISSFGSVSYSATFRGRGALVSTAGVADRTPFDSVPRFATGGIINGNNIGGFKIIKDDNTVTTPAVRKKQRTKNANRKNVDQPKGGFEIVP